MLNKISLKTAVWIYDIENFCILWANDAALEWWQSASPEELYSRNFRADTSDAVRESLKDYQKRFHAGESMCELWQFSPEGQINRAFLSSSEFCLVTLEAIHKLIKSLSMISLIEGVETEQQVNAISNIGIELCQGNYYAYPQPVDFYKKQLN